MRLPPHSLEILKGALMHLRHAGFLLGVGALLDVVRVAGDENISTLEDLRNLAQLLWCRSAAERRWFDDAWAAMLAVHAPLPELPAEPLADERVQEPPVDEQAQAPPEDPIRRPAPDSSPHRPPPHYVSLGVIIPPLMPRRAEHVADLRAGEAPPPHLMLAAWHRLHQSLSEGYQNDLDIKATVEQTARQGFFLAPIYRSQANQAASLVLLIDQRGSMTPFHHFTRDLVSTAQERIPQVRVVYFRNIPMAQLVFRDPYLIEPVSQETLLAHCLRSRGVFIVSDAGAARGYWRRERIEATKGFLRRLRQHTNRIAWLNPMPRNRWPGTSAEQIANLVPMFQFDFAGLGRAIDIISGRSHRRAGRL